MGKHTTRVTLVEGTAFSAGALVVTTKDPRFLPALPLCPCCGEGYSTCGQRRPDGTAWTHEDTCGRYQFGDNLCPRCIGAMFP